MVSAVSRDDDAEWWELKCARSRTRGGGMELLTDSPFQQSDSVTASPALFVACLLSSRDTAVWSYTESTVRLCLPLAVTSPVSALCDDGLTDSIVIDSCWRSNSVPTQ